MLRTGRASKFGEPPGRRTPAPQKMNEPIKGSFPGGPTRRGPDDPAPPPRRLRRVADIEARRLGRMVERRARTRRVRTTAALAAALAVAFGVGVALGLSSHRTAADLTAQREAGLARDRDVSSEVNRVLLELWKMEDVEHARSLGRIR